MLKLVVKDVRAQKGLMLFWGIYSLCFYLPSLFIEDWAPGVSLILVVIPVVVGALFVLGGAKSETANVELLVASFPISRRMMADAKYVGMGLAAAYGFVTSLAFGLAFRVATPRINFGGLDWLILPRILAALGLLSWIIPLYLKHGPDFIRKFAVVGLAAAVALQLILMLLLQTNASSFTQAFRSFLGWYRSFPAAARSLTFAAAGLASGAASWLASRRIMSRKEF
jgi:hypothetical protein